ncbi:uncharacterized protein LOC122643783 [Telopea speciosissima]|uniref:uncharacterized protein LOC122643783 n=1 Tax=Telopea speciosissima TaxID=54955 RepID=UPI001CC7F347|nr:uncharacterized protein LOC122643783 [Telopea speciosissima]
MEGPPKEINVSSVTNEVLTTDDEDNIPILTEENYMSWKEKMENLLKKKGLWDYVVGAKREPENTFSQEYEDWLQIKKEIVSLFRRKCGSETLQDIEKLDITLIWRQLVTMYEFTYPANTGKMKRKSTNYTWSLPFYKAIVDGNWKSVSEFLSKNEGVLAVRLTSSGELPLHVAVQNGKVKIAKEMLKNMSVEVLSRQEKDGKTILHIASVSGNKEIVRAIVQKDAKLVMIKSQYYKNCIPIIYAAAAGKKDVVNYLYPITIHQDAKNHKEEDHHNTGDDERETTRAEILVSLIFGDFYGK